MTEFLNEIAHQFQLPLQNNILVFSLILFIILLSPILLKRLNIPGIIGLIIAGVIIGPYGFNIIEQSDAIDLFSTIGLLYIMFIAGLELDLKEFKINKNKSLVFAAFTFFIPIAIGYPVCHYLLGYDFNTSLLTASMFATHTLVAYPIVSKLGISKNQAVAITVGGTILTDTAVLMILAVIIGNAEGDLNSMFWVRLGISLVIFSAIMFFLIPKIAKWFFKKLESEKYAHYIFVLAIVFFAAFLAEEAGVEAIIGAFVAGLALNKLIPPASVLMNRIEFLGNALFIPFFLISVGMLVDVRVIMSGPMALIVAGVLSAVAISTKWLAAWFTQLSFKYTNAQRQVIFGLSGAHAAATLAVILVGYRAGVIDNNILNGTIILILITCLVASFATEKAGKKLKIESESNTTDIVNASDASKEHILMPIDNVEKMDQLLKFGLLIKDSASPHPITVLSVVSNNLEAEKNIIKAKNKLKSFLKDSPATRETARMRTTVDHNVAGGISRISREVMADLIIMGWPHHARFFDKLMGEKIDSILNRTFKTSFVCHFGCPLKNHHRVVMLAPPLAETERGFELWATKIFMLSESLNIPLVVYCNMNTEKELLKIYEENRYTVPLTMEMFDDWRNIKTMVQSVLKEDDLFILVAARKESTSHLKVMDNLPSKIENQTLTSNYIVIYPQPYDERNEFSYTNVSTESIDRNLKSVKELGKELLGGFRKRK